jgi:hypothetical protein
MNGLFPEDSDARKEYPVYSGFLQYFPAAVAAIAHHSYKGNFKHNPGQPLHHDRAKSGDEPDAMMRHLMEQDLVGMAWRAMSMLQKHLEAQGAPIAPAARNATKAELVPHDLAAAMIRDGVVPHPVVEPLAETRPSPPNCDGVPFEPPYGDED